MHTLAKDERRTSNNLNWFQNLNRIFPRANNPYGLNNGFDFMDAPPRVEFELSMSGSINFAEGAPFFIPQGNFLQNGAQNQ